MRIIRWVEALVWLTLTCAHASAQTEIKGFCAAEVILQPTATSAFLDAEAKIIDVAGRTLQSIPFKDGKAHICDFGLGLHSIRIESRWAHPVLIENVRLLWGFPQKFYVFLNVYKGTPATGGNACKMYFRIENKQGQGLGDAQVTLLDRSERNLKADQYGRIVFLLPVGIRSVFTAQAPGYQLHSEEVFCETPAGGPIERLVTLEVK